VFSMVKLMSGGTVFSMVRFICEVCSVVKLIY
jgi:hypothetical protein